MCDVIKVRVLLDVVVGSLPLSSLLPLFSNASVFSGSAVKKFRAQNFPFHVRFIIMPLHLLAVVR